MKITAHVMTVIALSLSGCASAPTPAKPLVVTWPEAVADTCPKRTVSVECFRGPAFPREAIKAGMAKLHEQFFACIRYEELPIELSVTIETKGGAASCVDASVRDTETARCVAAVVARDLRIPDSPPDETCGFRFPFKFELPADDKAP